MRAAPRTTVEATHPAAKKVVQLGAATLHLGNCLEILPTLADGSVDLVLTDLPYGTTSCTWDSVIPLQRMWEELRRVGSKDCVFVFTAQQPFTSALCASNPTQFRHELIWEKPNGTSPFQAKFMPMKKHENVLVFCGRKLTYNPQMTEGKPYKWDYTRTKGAASRISQSAPTPIDNAGTRFPRSVLQFKQERGLHPTQKPVALMEWLIRTYSNPGAQVLDITMGSGTTCVAALNTGRWFTGMEIDAGYFGLAVDRLRTLVGSAPALVLDSEKKTSRTNRRSTQARRVEQRPHRRTRRERSQLKASPAAPA